MNFQQLIENRPAFQTAPISNSVQQDKVFFDVFESPLALGSTAQPVIARGLGQIETEGAPVESHKAICRYSDSGDPVVLGVVGDKYKLVPNVELFAAVEEALLAEAPEHAHTIKIEDKVSADGAFCSRTYHLPELKFDLKQLLGHGTTVSYKTTVWNTYDGSGSARLVSGGIDWVCLNGCVGTVEDVFSRKHTSGFSLPKFNEAVRAGLDGFKDDCSRWQEWAMQRIGMTEAEATLRALPGMSERRATNIYNQFRTEGATRGHSKWALYSALTYQASHSKGDFAIRDTGRDTEAQTLQRRSEQVAAWTNSAAWQAL